MITFWRPQDEYGYMSNFAHFGFLYAGVDYPTVEHFYQSMKHEGTELEEKIRRCYTPKQAKQLALSVSIDPVKWNDRKLIIMRAGLWHKFTDNWTLGGKLVDTVPHWIVEASPYDSYWGWGRDRKGENWLGRLLMEVRNMKMNVPMCTRCDRYLVSSVPHKNFKNEVCNA